MNVRVNVNVPDSDRMPVAGTEPFTFTRTFTVPSTSLACFGLQLSHERIEHFEEPLGQ